MSIRSVGKFLFCLWVINAAALPALAKSPPPPPGSVISQVVLQVYDGDGLWLDDGDGNQKTYLQVRLFGIDAPEFNQPGGQAAKQFLSGMIKGQRVRCSVMNIDRHQRPVSVCLNDAGRDLSCAVAWAGHARATDAKYFPCDRSKRPPPGPAPL